MNERITLEPDVMGNFYVMKNGEKQTGPLPPLDAEKEAEKLDPNRTKSGKRLAFKIVLVLTVATVLVTTAITGEFETGLLFGGICLVMMTVGVFWNSK